ncbi:MAG: hypothetical protein ACRETJ_00170 [Steroidobacteraceae bacterium]
MGGSSDSAHVVTFATGNDFWQPKHAFDSGPDWLALTCTGHDCKLEPASLVVKPQFQTGQYDDRPTYGEHLKFTAAHVSGRTVVAWLRTDRAPAWLKPRAVPTYFGPGYPLETDPKVGTLSAKIHLPDGTAALLVPAEITSALLAKAGIANTNLDSNYVLQLRASDKRQLLGAFGMCGLGSSFPSPREYLLWTGDLDGDGKPDYLIDFSVDADGSTELYLSGSARPGELVGLAAVYEPPPDEGECD